MIMLPNDRRLEKSVETVLLGATGKLDSLGLTLLFVGIEQKLEAEFGVEITLSDALLMSSENNPFQTIGILSSYIIHMLEEKISG